MYYVHYKLVEMNTNINIVITSYTRKVCEILNVEKPKLWQVDYFPIESLL